MNKFLFAAALFGAALTVRADDILSVAINTSSLSGTAGYIDFEFNPSPAGSQAATIRISNFAGATYIANSQIRDGAASGGPLTNSTAIVSIPNSAAFVSNDDEEGFTLGKTITFTLDFSGPAVSMPNGSSSPSTFTLFMTSDAAGLDPILTKDPNGVLASINISPNTGLAITSTTTPNLQFVPEPGSLALLGGGLVAGLLLCVRRRWVC